MDSEEALVRLVAGNQRFVRGESIHPHESVDWRRHVADDQSPLATILGCSDAHAPPEIIFDQGLGDLFVIRVAGNVISEDTLGSVLYAGAYWGTRLFVVLGHEGCGVVRAALEEKARHARQPGQIETLVQLILPAIQDIDPAAAPRMQLAAAVEANVRWSVAQITQMRAAQKAVQQKRVQIVGAIYEVQTGRVQFLD